MSSKITVGPSPEEQATALAALRAEDHAEIEFYQHGHVATVSGVLWLDGMGQLRLESVVRYSDGSRGPNLLRIISYTPPREAWEDADWVVWREDGRPDEVFRTIGRGDWVSVTGRIWTGHISGNELRKKPGAFHPAKLVVCDA